MLKPAMWLMLIPFIVASVCPNCYKIGEPIFFYYSVYNPYDTTIHVKLSIVAISPTGIHTDTVDFGSVPPHQNVTKMVFTHIIIRDYGPYEVRVTPISEFGAMTTKSFRIYVSSVGKRSCLRVCDVYVDGKHYYTLPKKIDDASTITFCVVVTKYVQVAKDYWQCLYFRPATVVGKIDDIKATAYFNGYFVARLTFHLPKSIFDGRLHKIKIWVADDPKAMVTYEIRLGNPPKAEVKVVNVAGYGLALAILMALAVRLYKT
ncbi:MAG: hypothetical protein L3J47_10915 [Sulfurovum sp.]|nr:hypothetical protein [Sulfurovum sp.]